jgi:hypothetical protein
MASTSTKVRLYQRIAAGVVTIALVLGLVPTAGLAEEVSTSAVTETAEQTTVEQVSTSPKTTDDASSTADADTTSEDAVTPSETVATTQASDDSSSDSESAAPAASALVSPAPSTSEDKVSVTVSIVGVDALGYDQNWAKTTTISLKKDSTVVDLTKELFAQTGITADYYMSSYGWFLNTITSPDGRTLGYDAKTGKYWQLFYNGSPAAVGASSITLSDGDSVVWYYSAYGFVQPANPDVPSAGKVTAPATSSDWPETEASGNVTTASTPTSDATESWAIDLKGEGDLWAKVSEPLVVDGKVIVAVNSTLKLLSNTSSSASVEKTLALDGAIDYTARPVYADGVIYVPLSGGMVEAVDYGSFARYWTSKSTARGDQSSCSLRLVDLGSTYAIVCGTAVMSSGLVASSGSLVALDTKTGSTLWSKASSTSGWYWTSALCVGDYLLASDVAGTTRAYDLDGNEVSSLSLGSAVASDPVAYDGGALVVTYDGVLHRLSLSSAGTLSDVTLKVLDKCIAAPTVVGTTAVVVGGTGEKGDVTTLALVDLASMRVSRTVTSVGGSALPTGGICAPALVSTQAGGSYSYFTVNFGSDPNKTWTGYGSGGNLYVYRLGDLEASLLYAPSATNANYCDSPVVCDAAGNLYYLNDSGYLVRLSASAGSGSGNQGSGSGNQESGSGNQGSGSGNQGSGTDDSGAGSSASSGTSGQSVSSGSKAASGRSLFSSLRSQPVTTSDSVSSAGEKDAAPVTALVTTSDGSAAENGLASTESALDTATGSDAVSTGTAALPIWPIVGMCVGLAALLWAVLGRRRRAKDEEVRS